MNAASSINPETLAFWEKRYGGDGFAFGTRPNEFLKSQAHRLKPGMRALVPGDGEGRNGVWLAGEGLIVDTVDISVKGVTKARALAAERGVSINAVQADLTTWTWPIGIYDVVAAIYVHFKDAERPAMHKAMFDALKPGGLFMLEAFHPDQIEMQKCEHSGGPKTPDMLYSAAKLRSDLPDAEFLLLDETVVDLDEGHRHKGKGVVVRMIARRPA